MSSGFTHSVIGGLSGFGVAIAIQSEAETVNPLLAIGTSTAFAKLPDILEPALNNPHHRQFCHSILVLAAIGYGIKKVYEWEPKNKKEALLRVLTLFAGTGYVSHLILDGFTPRSLPILGKI